MDTVMSAMARPGLSPADRPPEPASPCPDCGEHRWRYERGGSGSAGWRCIPCLTKKKRQGRRGQTRSCQTCGRPKPATSGYQCPHCFQQILVAQGETRFREREPEYAEALLARLQEPARSEFLRRLHRTTVGKLRYPAPSEIFPTLQPGIDAWLIKHGHNKNLALCEKIAGLPRLEQFDFCKLYLENPQDAEYWASLPKWKRPIRRGDQIDRLIWKYFAVTRLQLENYLIGGQTSRKLQGMTINQLTGILESLQRLSASVKVDGMARLYTVMRAYAYVMESGADLGDPAKAPFPDVRFMTPKQVREINPGHTYS